MINMAKTRSRPSKIKSADFLLDVVRNLLYGSVVVICDKRKKFIVNSVFRLQ